MFKIQKKKKNIYQPLDTSSDEQTLSVRGTSPGGAAGATGAGLLPSCNALQRGLAPILVGDFAVSNLDQEKHLGIMKAYLAGFNLIPISPWATVDSCEILHPFGWLKHAETLSILG